jgi:hypothetical protein
VKRVLITFLEILVFLGLVGFLWTFLPIQRQTQRIEFPPDLQIKFGSLVLQVDGPREIRLGENENLVVKVLSVSPENDIASSTNPPAILFQSKMEIPGITIEPSATLEDRFDDRGAVSFSWRMIPRETGDFSGTIWVYAQPAEVSAADGRTGEPIFALPVDFVVRQVLGFPLDILRWLVFTIALLGGIVIGIIFLITRPATGKYPSE